MSLAAFPDKFKIIYVIEATNVCLLVILWVKYISTLKLKINIKRTEAFNSVSWIWTNCGLCSRNLRILRNKSSVSSHVEFLIFFYKIWKTAQFACIFWVFLIFLDQIQLFFYNVSLFSLKRQVNHQNFFVSKYSSANNLGNMSSFDGGKN